jgi:hypothetical protein
MAKTTILLLLLLLSSVLVAAATQLSPAAEKYIGDLHSGIQKVIDAVVSAAPPDKQLETLHAAQKHLKLLSSALDKAKETGDEKKIARLVLTVELTAAMIKAAPPEKKLKTMEDSMNSVAAPSPLDCPTVDKAFCEMHAKVETAVNGVTAAAPAGKMSEAQAAVVKETLYNAGATISKAYADGDEKKIAQVLAAYVKAADAVTAAAPADKLIVLEKTFAAAAAGN